MLDANNVISSDPEILGGEKVFAGTRVPVGVLLDYFAGGQTLGQFLEDFPSVSHEQAEAALLLAREVLTAGARSS